jgi:cytochrome c oxidase subunit 4
MALDTTAAHNQAAGEHQHLHGGPKIYAAVFGALVFLTVITVGASYVNWGSGLANVMIAMLIASIKASLVALFFMHLRWDRPTSAMIFCVSLFFLGLFMIGCYTDMIARPPTEPANMKSQYAPGGQIRATQGQPAPMQQQHQQTPSGLAPAQGSHGAAAGTNAPAPAPSH